MSCVAREFGDLEGNFEDKETEEELVKVSAAARASETGNCAKHFT